MEERSLIASVFRNNGKSMKRLTADQVKVGFIGLGNMGSRIARRLLHHATMKQFGAFIPGLLESLLGHGQERSC